MKKRSLLLGLCGVAAAVAPTIAAANLVTDAAPSLGGQSAKVVYYVNGVTKNNGMETEFVCTSLDSSGTYHIGVEIYDETGAAAFNNVSAGDGEEIVAAGGTLTIGTGNTAGFHETEVITAMPLNLRGGSARIVSTSRRLFCQAFLVEELASPPAAFMPLKVIGRKQNGD
jgi:hypothetical protein